ncbi:MAG: hypothetical protein LBE91_04615, partial [Tannerella sp.]|nr:hypothetical protein [Tannerella sp.]
QLFIPQNIEYLLDNYGNKKLYDNQQINFDMESIKEDNLLKLLEIIHKHKKGLEQEIFINDMSFTGINSKIIDSMTAFP